MPRLDKILSDSGLGSRGHVRSLIRSGAVKVNGSAAFDPAAHFEYDDEFTAGGVPVICQKHIYIMMNKPAGILSATEDSRAPTALDLLPAEYRARGVAPAGRLDKDAEGFLLLTNDGGFSHKVTSPKSGLGKTYAVTYEGEPADRRVKAFADGIRLPDGTLCLPALLEADSGSNTARLTVTEGKFHQVKRMFAAGGMTVIYLKRLSIGGLALDPSLAPGEWRIISPQELEILLSEGPISRL